MDVGLRFSAITPQQRSSMREATTDAAGDGLRPDCRTMLNTGVRMVCGHNQNRLVRGTR
jgi:hypothetical protein